MGNILDYLPGIVIPLVMFYFFFLIPLRRVRDARSWRKTSCVIVASSVSEDATDSGLYRMLVAYQYDFAGRYYSSSRYSFSPSSATAGYRGKKRVAGRLAPGTTTFCYVNPDNPQDAVIERGLTWDTVIWGVFAIIFLGVFLFFFLHGVPLGRVD
jgi:Protein of unknown function (DUF3592)